LSLAPRLEHVVCQIVFVVFPAVVLAQENLDATPRARDSIGVGAGFRIHELDAVVHSRMGGSCMEGIGMTGGIRLLKQK